MRHILFGLVYFTAFQALAVGLPPHKVEQIAEYDFNLEHVLPLMRLNGEVGDNVFPLSDVVPTLKKIYPHSALGYEARARLAFMRARDEITDEDMTLKEAADHLLRVLSCNGGLGRRQQLAALHLVRLQMTKQLSGKCTLFEEIVISRFCFMELLLSFRGDGHK